MEKKPIHIFFGSMTGNAEDLAERTQERLQSEGYEIKIDSLDSYDPQGLSNVQRTVIVISTWGEGDPPDECEDFCYALYDNNIPNVAHLEYAILALGDSSYDDFCGCGRKVDEALAKAGAKSFLARKELDVDFDDDYDVWVESLVQTLAN